MKAATAAVENELRALTASNTSATMARALPSVSMMLRTTKTKCSSL